MTSLDQIKQIRLTVSGTNPKLTWEITYPVLMHPEDFTKEDFRLAVEMMATNMLIEFGELPFTMSEEDGKPVVNPKYVEKYGDLTPEKLKELDIE